MTLGQYFIPRSRLQQEAYALTGPGNFLRAISVVVRGTALLEISDGFTTTMVLVRMDIGLFIRVSRNNVEVTGDVHY